MADDNILALIRERALANGVDPAMLTRIAQIESNLNPNARARTSSAGGLFQFITPTWNQFGGGADRFDPHANADAGARFTAANIGGLRAAGHEPTPANTYLAHFSGLGGARKVLGADPTARVADVLGADVVRANPFLANMSVADMRAWAERKMSGAPPAAGPGVVPSSPVTGMAPAAGPSQTGAVPVAPEAAAGEEDQLLRTLQALSSPPAERSTMPAPPPLRINMAEPAGRAAMKRARALAAAMARRTVI